MRARLGWLVAGLLAAAPAFAISDIVTYQGSLEESGQPANGVYDLSFQLFDASTGVGNVSPVVEVGDVAVAKGVFTVEIDFGFAQFHVNAEQWLEVGVRPGAATGAYQLLAPRQALRATPYAHYAASVGPLAVGAEEILSNEVQRRVTGTCPPGSPVVSIGSTGTVVCDSSSAGVPSDNSDSGIDVTGVVGSSLSMVIASDGRPSIAYHDATNGDLKYTHCLNDSCTSRTPLVTLDSAGVVGINPSIANRAGGGIQVTYFDQSNSALKHVNCTSLDCASFAQGVTLENTGAVGIESSVDYSAGGTVVAFYRDSTNTALNFLRCQNFGCTAVLPAAPVVIDAAGDVGTNITGRLDPDGDFSVVYTDATNTAVKFARCGANVCGSPTTLTVNSATLTGATVDYVFGASGYPLIASVDASGNIVVTACTTRTCSASTSSNLSLGPAGKVSMALGPDGIPVIAYYYSTTQDLRFARCTNATCAGNAAGATETILATTGDLGSALDVVVGGDNRPGIAYFDATAGDLRYYKCPNAFCLSYFGAK